MPTNDDLLFAEHVVKAGFLTREEVEESLSVQRRMAEMGVQDSLRSVLVKRGALREGDAAVVARNAGLRSGGEPIPGYTLEARLGSGAMGSVYKAYQKGMKRHVAIKILRRDLTDDPRQVERLQREAALVGKLDHPNIVRGLDSGESDGLVWFVMELVDGESLRERITRLGRIDQAEAVRIARQIAEALDHASSLGVIHRDVKPGNILVSKEGLPRLTDYGLAKGESDDALTQLDATLGTPQYISPEQARNPRDADVRSDIYSLGATLYAMLTGHPPFAGESMAATLTKVLYERPQPVADEVEDLDPALGYVVERMMAKDRRHRYQTPSELLHDLTALEQGRLVVPAGFKGDISEFVETRRHRRMWFAGAGLMAAAIAIAAGALVWERHSDQVRREREAEHELASLRTVAGPRDAWDGDKVQQMLAAFERFGRDYAGTPAATEALGDSARWAAQAGHLQRTNELALRAGEAPPEWPRLVAEIERREAELRDVADASVARRRLVALAAEVRNRRDRRAAQEAESAETAAAGEPSLEQAARRYEELTRTLRERYFGEEPSPLLEAMRATSARFREAAAEIDRRFSPHEERAGAGGALARGEFRALEQGLAQAYADAQRDPDLSALLASLPPVGRRVNALAARYDALRGRLTAASAAAWESARRSAEESRARRDFRAAIATLQDFAAHALDAERDKADALRLRIESQQEGLETGLRTAAEETTLRFLQAMGRRDYALAREALASLEPEASLPGANPAAEIVAGGRHLLDLVERHLWTPLRERFAKGGVLERGLNVRSGQGFRRFPGVRDVKFDGRELWFTWEGGPYRGSRDDLALDDVVYYAGLVPGDAERALVLAAVRLAEFAPGGDPGEDIRALAETMRLLDEARGAPELRAMAARLARHGEERLAAATLRKTDVEDRAEALHRAARDHMAAGRFDDAWRDLGSLLELPTYYRTEYVKRLRDEIEKQRQTASRGRQQLSFAAQFPGAVLTRAQDGTGELFFDFENAAIAGPDGRKLLGLVEGRTEVASRPAVVVDQPSLSLGRKATLPLVLEHVLAWRPADAGGSPRRFPVSLDCPFASRSRIGVSFLYRSDEPFFLAVSIGGVTAGVLSAADDLYGGRGVQIWGAGDLERPDEAFDDRYRRSYLAKHPEALRKEGDKRFFCFEPGRTYRVEFVKDERRASLYVDGQLRLESDWRPVTGSLEGRIVLASFGPGEIDDLRISGTLDPDWLKGR